MSTQGLDPDAYPSFDIDYQIPLIDLTPIRKSHHTIPIDSSHPLFDEPMVNLWDYDIAFVSWHAIDDGSNQPYFCAIKGSRQEGWLRKTVADKLQRVNDNLRPFGAEILIYDAYRPIACQRGLWEFFYERARQEIPQASEEDCREYALGYVRDPRLFDKYDTRTFPIHITGSSVDVVLKRLGSEELIDLGSEFEEIIDVSVTDYFERQLLAGNIRADDQRLLNRRLMDWAFTKEGFLNDPILYWHYDWGNQLWIKVKNVRETDAPKQAWYGYIDPPKWGVPDAGLTQTSPIARQS